MTCPDYYMTPDGVEVKEIARHCSGNGAQAIQYIYRATNNHAVKGDRVDDLMKAADMIQDEIDRLLCADMRAEDAAAPDRDSLLAFDAALDDLAATPTPLLPPAQLAAALSILDMLRGEA
jgi:hypothetical protein